MKITKNEIHDIILIHTARTWERIRLKQEYQEMTQDNIRSSTDAIPEIAFDILNTDVVKRFLNYNGNDWDWGKETKGYAYMSDCYIEQKAFEIIYNHYI